MSSDVPHHHPLSPPRSPVADRRLFLLCTLAIPIALGAGILAKVLVALIGLFTNLSFYGRFSLAFIAPAGNTLGAWVIVVPVIGGLIVGAMARWGSPAIRGHGIPEVMERVLVGESRIPPRNTILKPVGTAISIGTGGPFGAEGPIIATGGALGSLVGQALRVTADERKILLAPRADGDAPLRNLVHRAPVVVSGHHSRREAEDLMVQARVGRLPVVAEDGSGTVVGILSRSDLLAAHERRLDEHRRVADATLWG